MQWLGPNVVTTAATVLPVSIKDVREQEGIDGSYDDHTINRAVRAAVRSVEHYSGRTMISTSYTLYFNAFPGSDSIWLPQSPLISVTSVKYYDTSGSQQTLATSVYTVDTYETPGRIYLKRESSQQWPNTEDREYACEILYVAGYGTDETGVPDDLRHAICLTAAEWVRSREALTDEKLMPLPMGVQYLIAPHELIGADS